MIVALAGRIASGKSAVSRAVAKHYSVPRVSFGDAVRAEARRRGLGDSRTVLQDLGDELIAEGWEAFCNLVVGQVMWDGRSSLVVDGVRHLGALEELRRLVGTSRLLLVFVETPWERRLEWLAERGVTGAEAIEADRHPNEGELEAVMAQADVVVVNDADLDRVVREVIASVEGAGGVT